MHKKVLLIVSILVMMFVLASPAAAAAKTWSDVVDNVEKDLKKAIVTYKKGNVAGAKHWLNEAYFGPYEGEQMEKAVRLNISAKANAQVEAKFKDIKKAMSAKKPVSQVENQVDELEQQLRQLAKEMDGSNSGSFGTFLSSFLVLVREGFEAILILGAIIAYLLKSGNRDKVKVIYQAGLIAILASLATAALIKFFFKISGASQEILEGVTMLIAVVVLFSVSFWLISKTEAKKWQNYIEGKVKHSIGKGSTAALWFTVFLAVYREGAETVLFYLAMFSGAGQDQYSAITIGILAGAVILVALFAVVRYGSLKIPLKPFFLGTSILMYLLAFVFAGQGINELQASGLVGITSVAIPPVALLGIYPTMESLGVQSMLLLAALFGVMFNKLFQPKTGKLAG